jgi:prophage regulatory protein
MASEVHQSLLRKREVLRITGWSNSTLYNRILDGTFKRPVSIGPRLVAWPENEVFAYVNSCIAVRDKKCEGGKV